MVFPVQNKKMFPIVSSGNSDVLEGLSPEAIQTLIGQGIQPSMLNTMQREEIMHALMFMPHSPSLPSSAELLHDPHALEEALQKDAEHKKFCKDEARKKREEEARQKEEEERWAMIRLQEWESIIANTFQQVTQFFSQIGKVSVGAKHVGDADLLVLAEKIAPKTPAESIVVIPQLHLTT